MTIICADDISSSINTLLKNFYKSIKKNHNLIFSPFGLHSTLSVIYEGAAGETATSLQNALNVWSAKDIAFQYKPILDNIDAAENITLNIANKLYVQKDYKINEGFQATAQIYFDVSIEAIDFTKRAAAAAQINNWVKEKTSYKIEKVVDADAFNPFTQAVLVNAIYFKGDWLFQFNEHFTVMHQFYISETESISHPMMYQEAPFDYAVNAELDAQILRLQHQNPRYSMTIVLPNSRTGIKKLEKNCLIWI
ncbi:serine protease inhibitor serpin [Holotrichia oblita]|uniref:Serine protease inhibitor serpin n=1 Tax=Holotrichia oblita TaxID=644536 RepID=A0ACB9SSN5_HOLOL|nr:serine protease inhibitor serpin [Holotrichia oblita]